MAMSMLDSYRKHWPRVGAVLGMILGGATALAARGRMTNLRALSAVNWIALLVHQYEEYEDPGYFPGQFNRGIFKSDNPLNYPLNTRNAMCINTAIAYPFYALPVLFPMVKWLGIAPVLFGMSQAVGHGVIFPVISRSKYSPGFLASIFLHTPIGLAYLTALKSQGRITRGDWIKSIAYTVVFAFFGVASPNLLFKDKNSPHVFTEEQMVASARGRSYTSTSRRGRTPHGYEVARKVSEPMASRRGGAGDGAGRGECSSCPPNVGTCHVSHGNCRNPDYTYAG